MELLVGVMNVTDTSFCEIKQYGWDLDFALVIGLLCRQMLLAIEKFVKWRYRMLDVEI